MYRAECLWSPRSLQVGLLVKKRDATLLGTHLWLRSVLLELPSPAAPWFELQSGLRVCSLAPSG